MRRVFTAFYLVSVISLLGAHRLQEQFANHWRDYSLFKELIISRSDDPSLVMGQVASTIVVRRKPLTQARKRLSPPIVLALALSEWPTVPPRTFAPG
jgi:hypothetical protein